MTRCEVAGKESAVVLNNTERRSSQRVKVEIPATLFPHVGGRLRGTVSNLSMTGMFIEVPEELPDPDPLLCDFVTIKLDIGAGIPPIVCPRCHYLVDPHLPRGRRPPPGLRGGARRRGDERRRLAGDEAPRDRRTLLTEMGDVEGPLNLGSARGSSGVGVSLSP